METCDRISHTPKNSVSDSDGGHRDRRQSRVSSWQEYGAGEDAHLMRRAPKQRGQERPKEGGRYGHMARAIKAAKETEAVGQRPYAYG
jgi:hypothetical protein